MMREQSINVGACMHHTHTHIYMYLLKQVTKVAWEARPATIQKQAIKWSKIGDRMEDKMDLHVPLIERVFCFVGF